MEPIVRLSLRETVIWMCLLQLNCSHKAVAHVLELLGNFPGWAVEVVCVLFLLVRGEASATRAGGSAASEGRKGATREG